MKSCGTQLTVLAAWIAAATTINAQTATRAGTATAPAPEEPTLLSVFVVNEETNVGYASVQTTSGMRTVQQLKNVANSISVLNSEVIADIGATSLQEISKYFVSGEEAPGPANFASTVSRGIASGAALRNGWIWYSPQDTYVTERVELLRGPNAFLYGESTLGGNTNNITKRGLFTRDFTRVKVSGGAGGPSSDSSLSNYHLRRLELDFNRVIKRDTVALRLSSVASNGAGWDDNASSRVRGIYGAFTYRPFRSTQIDVMVERTLTTNVRAQGLFSDQFSYTTRTTLTNANGLVYVPATGQIYRATGQVRSAGSGLTIVDPTVVPRGFQVTGPNNTGRDNFNSLSIEVSQRIGRNLNLLLSGNAYQRKTDIYGQGVGAAVYRDLSPLLPGGAANPNFNRLYTEYQRTDAFSGNTVRDVRLSAVYDFKASWMKQQIVANLQQHQDTPLAQAGAKFAEFIDPANPNFIGTIDPAISLAANTTNRSTFPNNRFNRRYYLGDGDSGRLTGEMTGRPGVSAWYPVIVAAAFGGTYT